MGRSIAAEASSWATGVILAVVVGLTGMEGTGGVGDTAEGSSGKRPVDVNQLKVRVKSIASRMRTQSPNHRIKGRVVAPVEVGGLVVS